MRDRLVLVPDEAGQRTEEVPFVDDDLVRVGPNRLRDLARVDSNSLYARALKRD